MVKKLIFFCSRNVKMKDFTLLKVSKSFESGSISKKIDDFLMKKKLQRSDFLLYIEVLGYFLTRCVSVWHQSYKIWEIFLLRKQKI